MTNAESVGAIRQTVEELEIAGGSAAIYEGYSGRGMFGASCYGISSPDISSATIIEAAALNGLRGARTDQLGKGVIVYWPSVKYTQKETNE